MTESAKPAETTLDPKLALLSPEEQATEIAAREASKQALLAGLAPKIAATSTLESTGPLTLPPSAGDVPSLQEAVDALQAQLAECDQAEAAILHERAMVEAHHAELLTVALEPFPARLTALEPQRVALRDQLLEVRMRLYQAQAVEAEGLLATEFSDIKRKAARSRAEKMAALTADWARLIARVRKELHWARTAQLSHGDRLLRLGSYTVDSLPETWPRSVRAAFVAGVGGEARSIRQSLEAVIDSHSKLAQDAEFMLKRGWREHPGFPAEVTAMTERLGIKSAVGNPWEFRIKTALAQQLAGFAALLKQASPGPEASPLRTTPGFEDLVPPLGKSVEAVKHSLGIGKSGPLTQQTHAVTESDL